MEQKSLLPADPEPEDDGWVDLLQVHSREALGLGPEWWAYQRETLEGQVFKVTLATSNTVYKSGPRKGQRKIDRKTEKVFMCSIKEHRAWEESWAKRTGNCSHCTGIGKTLARSSAAGMEYRICRTCKGTGKRTESHG